MFEIIAYSALVSLVTLTALLLRRTRPESTRLWTHRYGANKDLTMTRIHLSTPPWFLWLLVALITLSFAGAYFRDESTALSHRAGSDLSVWVDRSLSTQLTLNHVESLRRRIASDLLARASQLKFIESELIWDSENNSWSLATSFSEFSNLDDIANHLKAEPSPLGFNLSAEALRTAFEKRHPGKEVRGELLVVTDGQAATVQNLARLSDLFRELTMIPVPPVVPQAKIEHEWVPVGLAQSWGIQTEKKLGTLSQQSDPWALTPLESFDDGKLNHSNQSLPSAQGIPSEARPGLFSAFISGAETQEQPLYQIISSQSGLVPESAVQERASTIFTHCSAYPSGPAELSPVADLQALAQFFSVKVRTVDCAEQTEGLEKDTRILQPNELDEWTFRRSSVWLVPLEESVLNTFRFQKRLWIPNGFREESDTLVYYTDPRSAQMGAGRIRREMPIGDPSGILNLPVRETPVQLEKDGAPLALLLAPVPTLDPLEFNPSHSKNSGSPTSFEVFAAAFDSTPLIYRLGGERVYYLRTPLAMPNSELGRTGFWPTFWLDVLRESPDGLSGLVIHHALVPEEFDLPAPNSLRRVSLPNDGETMSPISPVRSGLFVDQENHTLHLIEAPPSERDGQFLNADELADIMRRKGEGETQTSESQDQVSSKQTPLHALLAALAGILSLALYWFKLSGGKKAVSAQSLLLILILNFPIHERAAFAQAIIQNPENLSMLQSQYQRLPDPLSVPFRIAWCSDRNRDKVTEGFKKFRDLLERRGTIHLQPDLVFGSCVPGNAEIWWTDSVTDLDPDFLKFHVQSGGVFIVESYKKGTQEGALLPELARLEELPVGLRWEQPEKRGMLYRSFYLLQTFDGCAPDETLMLTLRKKQTAKSPVGVLTSASFFGMEKDCFGSDDDYRGRSFINLMYTLLTMDYKEDQLQLPELLRRVRNLGLEP